MIDLRNLKITAAFFTILVALLLVAAFAAAEKKLGTGVFPDADSIEGNLVRGSSTRADVQNLLGVPSGGGGAMLPGYGDKSDVVEPYDVWYYEDVELGEFETDNSQMVADMRQQILVIFFREDKFHGYFWTSTQKVSDGK